MTERDIANEIKMMFLYHDEGTFIEDRINAMSKTLRRCTVKFGSADPYGFVKFSKSMLNPDWVKYHRAGVLLGYIKITVKCD